MNVKLSEHTLQNRSWCVRVHGPSGGELLSSRAAFSRLVASPPHPVLHLSIYEFDIFEKNHNSFHRQRRGARLHRHFDPLPLHQRRERDGRGQELASKA